MNAQEKLDRILAAWDADVRRFAEATNTEATASVDYEEFAAKTRARLRSEAEEAGFKHTVGDLADLVIIADVNGLKRAAKLAAAEVTHLRKALDLWEARADAARSEVSTERASNEAWAKRPERDPWPWPNT